MDYIDLENQNSFVNLEEVDIEKVKPTEEPKVDLVDFDIPQIDFTIEPKEDEEIFGESCGIEQYYGDADKDDYFKRENLFSELVDDYQRAMARFNLGIAEEYAMLWGNIKGNIENQEDLYNYIQTQFAYFADRYTGNINDLLRDWGTEIHLLMESKLDKLNPHLEGEATVDIPDPDDYSNRIPSTQWVVDRLIETGEYNLKYLTFSPDNLFVGDPKTTVTLSWDFYEWPQEIRIDGVQIPLNITQKQFVNIDKSFTVKFSYKMEERWYHKIVIFRVLHGIYYGKSRDYASNTRTQKDTFSIDLGENDFVYLHIPNDGLAKIYNDNILGGFKRIDLESINGIAYFVYRSIHPNLGKLNIHYDNQQ